MCKLLVSYKCSFINKFSKFPLLEKYDQTNIVYSLPIICRLLHLMFVRIFVNLTAIFTKIFSFWKLGVSVALPIVIFSFSISEKFEVKITNQIIKITDFFLSEHKFFAKYLCMEQSMLNAVLGKFLEFFF